MNKPLLNVIRYGRKEALPEQKRLHAGPLTVVFEEDELRYIRFGNHEILRRIYVAVRDHLWNTIPSRVSNLQLESNQSSFHITFDVEHQQGEIDFYWRGTIEGAGDGTILFRMDGEARSTFRRNRIGICVLHPIKECAGKPCAVEKVDGEIEEGTFPRFISPHQPFKKMRAITHAVVEGLKAEVRFSGDVFEMEDQRNWTDASYKTYSTPLELPFPVEVRQGTKIAQEVRLTLHGQALSLETEGDEITFRIFDTDSKRLPQVGLGIASHKEPLGQREIERLKVLNLSHLRVDLRLSEQTYRDDLDRAAREAKAIGLPLEVALFLSDNAEDELASLVFTLAQIRPEVCRWLIFHTEEKVTSSKWRDVARNRLADFAPHAQFGGGTNIYFTELNRNRPMKDEWQLLCYSMNPQVHAFDNASLIETLQTQSDIAESARQFIGDSLLAATPVTLKPRFNPNATAPNTKKASSELPDGVDERQMSLFGAGWTAGSLKYIFESGIASVTYFETSGWRGVMERKAGSPLPEKFPSLPDSVYPLYHVFADVGEFAGGSVIRAESSQPLKVDGLVLSKDKRTRIILANLSADEQRVRLNLPHRNLRMMRLNETNAERAMLSPEEFRERGLEMFEHRGGNFELTLLAYETVRLDYDSA